MPSIWENFNHVFEVFQGLYFAFLLQRKDALGTRLLLTISSTNFNLFPASNSTDITFSLYKTSGPSNHFVRLSSQETTLVRMSAGLCTPSTGNHLSLSTTFLIFTTRLSTQGLQDFSLPFIQQQATLESDQQQMLFTQICFVTIDKASLITFLKV